MLNLRRCLTRPLLWDPAVGSDVTSFRVYILLEEFNRSLQLPIV
jgi:hypothetical protein